MKNKGSPYHKPELFFCPECRHLSLRKSPYYKACVDCVKLDRPRRRYKKKRHPKGPNHWYGL